MILQTFTDEELYKELLAEINDGIIDKLLYWAGRQVKKSEVNSEAKKTIGNFILSWPPVNLNITKRNNQFIAVNVTIVENSDGLGHYDSYPVILLYLKMPEKYSYRNENGKKKTGVIRDGYQYVMFSRNPKGEQVFFRVTSHFLDRIYQRSKIFREEHNKRSAECQNIIQTLSEVFTCLCIAFSFDEDDINKESSNEFIQNLIDKSDEDIIKKYLSDGSFPIRFLDGYAIVKCVSSTNKIGVLKTFIHESKVKENQSTIGNLVGGESGRNIIEHVSKY